MRFLRLHSSPLVFPTRVGTRQVYADAHRQFRDLLRELNIEPAGFHILRRTYARNYLKNGGNLFYLQASLGHARLETTKLYVEVNTDDLKHMHLRTSILSRLR